MSEIEKLYYNMEKLSDDWVNMPETEAASDILEKALGDEAYQKFENEICDYGVANEKQGFIKGFQYAVQLLASGRTMAVNREIA